MDTINIRYLAKLYYDIMKPGHYDWNNPKDRNKARANFVKDSKLKDSEALAKAKEQYMQAVKDELAGL